MDIHKEDEIEPNEDEVTNAKRYVRPERHIKRADFQRIEELPQDKFELEIQRKIAVEADAPERAMREEEVKLFLKAFKRVSLTDMERACVAHTWEGLRTMEVARRLGISHSTVQWYLETAVRKIKTFLKKHYESEWRKIKKNKKR